MSDGRVKMSTEVAAGMARAGIKLDIALGPRPPWWRPFARRAWLRDVLIAQAMIDMVVAVLP